MNGNTLIGLILLGIGGILFFNRKAKGAYMPKQLLPSLDKSTGKVYASPSEDNYETNETNEIHEKTPKIVPVPTPPINVDTYTGWELPPEGEPYKRALDNASRIYNLPKNLLARVAYQESRFIPSIINGTQKSSKGAVGIMQIIPKWHPTVDPTNPNDAIGYAAGYLSKLYNQLGSWPQALAAYNWGIGNLRNKGIENAPLETRNYIDQILSDISFYQNVG